MNNFEIFNETDEQIDIEEERKFIEYALKALNLENVEFNIIFVDNEKIREINKQYRGIDRPTDVISFAYNDDETDTAYAGDEIGDIFICLDRAAEQAVEYEHSLEREVGFLAVHGYLHLKGYDHMTKEEEKVMFKKQEEILDAYGLKR